MQCCWLLIKSCMYQVDVHDCTNKSPHQAQLQLHIGCAFCPEQHHCYSESLCRRRNEPPGGRFQLSLGKAAQDCICLVVSLRSACFMVVHVQQHDTLSAFSCHCSLACSNAQTLAAPAACQTGTWPNHKGSPVGPCPGCAKPGVEHGGHL